MKKVLSFILLVLTVAFGGLSSHASEPSTSDVVYSACSLSSSNDKYISYQEEYLKQLGVDQVWDAGITGKTSDGRKIRICVVDSGIDTDHPDFYDANGKCVISDLSYNASTKTVVKNGGMSVIEDQKSAGYHGTMVAGMICAQYGNGVGIAGIAYDAEIVVIKCDYDSARGGYKSNDDLIEGIRYAIELGGVDIINLSFTANRGSSMDGKYRELFQKANEKGITVVAATGNDFLSQVSSPACIDGAIGVGALNSKLTARDNYSNYGKETDVLAPGTVITTCVDDEGNSVYSANSVGTSFAAPIVSGIIALYKCQYPNATPDQIYSALKASSVDMGEFGKDDENGYGRVNAKKMVLGTYGTLTLDHGFGETEEIVFLKNSRIQDDLSSPVKEGAIFGGWYTDEDFTTEFQDIRYNIWNKDTTLYAKWLYELKIYRDGVLFETHKLSAGSEIPELPLPEIGFETVYENAPPETMPDENTEIRFCYKLIPLTLSYTSSNVEKIYDGRGVTLSLTAEHVLENIVYKWYRNGTLIEGENGNTLSLTGSCTSEYGDSYRCVVTLEKDGQKEEKEHVFTVKITPKPSNGSVSNAYGSDAPSSVTYNGTGVIIVALSIALIVGLSVIYIKKERK